MQPDVIQPSIGIRLHEPRTAIATPTKLQIRRCAPDDNTYGFSAESEEGIEQTPMSIAEKFVSMEYGPAPEDSKEAIAWLGRHGHRLQHFIGGGWQAPAAGQYFDTLDPSNGKKNASLD